MRRKWDLKGEEVKKEEAKRINEERLGKTRKRREGRHGGIIEGEGGRGGGREDMEG